MRWVLPTAALALAVVAIMVSRSREFDLDARGCATVVSGEPLGTFVFLWAGLLLAGAGLCYAIRANRVAVIAFAAVAVLIIGYLTLNLHHDADWQLTNDALGIKMCRE